MSKPLQLIVENDFHDFQLIVEKENMGRNAQIKVTGPYIVANEKNANGRQYAESMMNPVVENFNKGMIGERRAFGELEHPPTVEIDLKNACHLITNLEKQDNVWMGTSTILNTTKDREFIGTPNGDIVAAIIMAGGKIGMSTRGVGYMNGEDVEDYELVTVDVVANPSGPDCFVNGICESKSFLIDTHGTIMEQAINKFENGIANIPRANKKDMFNGHLDDVFKQFLRELPRI